MGGEQYRRLSQNVDEKVLGIKTIFIEVSNEESSPLSTPVDRWTLRRVDLFCVIPWFVELLSKD